MNVCIVYMDYQQQTIVVEFTYNIHL